MTTGLSPSGAADSTRSNAEIGGAGAFGAPMRIDEILRGIARSGEALPMVPTFGSTFQVQREWQTCAGGIGAELPTGRTPAERLEALHLERARAFVAQIREAVSERPTWATRVFPKDLRERFAIPQGLEHALTAALLEEPWATAVRRRDNVIRSWCLLPGEPAARPLRELIQSLPSCDTPASRGRRGAAGRDELTGLTDSQRGDGLSLATLLERSGLPAGLDPSDGPALLGRADFPESVARLSDTVARQKAAARGVPWSPATNTMRQKLIGAARNLQAVARRHGLIAVRAAADGGLPPAPAAELVPLLEQWRRELDDQTTDGGSTLRADRGLRVLGCLLTQLGWLAPTQVDAGALRDRVEHLRGTGVLGDEAYYSLRHVWKRLAPLNDRAPLSSRRVPARFFNGALVTTALGARERALVVELATESDAIFPDGEALLGGPLGLRRIVRFLTAASHLLRPDADLPRHRVSRRQVMKRAGGATPELAVAYFGAPPTGHKTAPAITDATTENLCLGVRRIANLARAVDPAADVAPVALARVATVERVAACDRWITIDERHQGVLSPRGRRLVDQLAAVSWAAAQLAAHDGDPELARRVLEERDALLEWAARLQPEGRGAQTTLKRVVDIDLAWRGSDNVAGFVKLGTLRDCIVGRAEQRAGLPLEAQAAALAGGGRPTWATRQWAIDVRNALLLHLLRLMPLRSREVVQLTRAMFTARLAGRPAEIWTAGARVEVLVPAAVMKASRHREGILADTGDDATTESRFMRRLFELYLMPGGARDVLGASGDWFFVSDTGGRLRPVSASQVFQNEVLRYAAALAMDPDQLRRLYGACRVHAVRALVGRYFAHDLGNPFHAMVLLHHKDLKITVERYVGLSGRNTRVALPN